MGKLIEDENNFFLNFFSACVWLTSAGHIIL